MRFRHILRGAAVAVLLAGAAHATTLRLAIASDMRTTMPGATPDVYSGLIRQNIYEGLVAWTSDGSVKPMLADTIKEEDGGKTYVFTLRDGVKFHNGAPLTSAEVVWTWRQFLDGKTPWACRSSFRSDFLNVVSVEAIDTKTVAFHLAAPSGAFLSAMARSDCDSTGIAHPDSVDAQGNWVKAIGTGPFMLTRWERGKLIELKKFDGYVSRTEPTDGLAGAKKPLVDTISAQIVPDPSVVVSALKTGAIDLWPYVESKFVPDLKGQPGLTVVSGDAAAVYTLAIRTDQPVVDNVKFRQALAYAIDTDALRDALTSNISAASRSLVPVTSQFYGPVERDVPAYDPAKAKQLLAESGYKGQVLTITTNNDDAMMADTAIYVQGMLSAIGVNAKVDTMEFATQFSRFYAGNYQVMTWNVTPYLDPVFIFERFIGNRQTQKDKVWTSDEAQALLRALFAAETPDAKQAVIDKLHKLFVTEVPMIVWAARSTIAAYGPRVHGFEAWPGQKARFWNISVTQ